MQQHSFDLVATSMLHSTFSVPCANWKPTGVSEMFAMNKENGHCSLCHGVRGGTRDQPLL